MSTGVMVLEVIAALFLPVIWGLRLGVLLQAFDWLIGWPIFGVLVWLSFPPFLVALLLLCLWMFGMRDIPMRWIVMCYASAFAISAMLMVLMPYVVVLAFCLLHFFCWLWQDDRKPGHENWQSVNYQ